jgi:hypothetical protein
MRIGVFLLFLMINFYLGDSRYIIIECNAGLSNRLRLLAGYMTVMKSSVSNFSAILMVWSVTPACPGHFLDLFQPIPNVKFIYHHEIIDFRKEAVDIYPPSFLSYLSVLRAFNVPQRPPSHPWIQLETYAYQQFRPRAHLLRVARSFVHSHHICESIALHIRHTDLNNWLRSIKKPITNDIMFDNYIHKFPPSTSIFLMTDNFKTQSSFLEKYPQRMIVYSNLSKSFTPQTLLQPRLNHTTAILGHNNNQSLIETIVRTTSSILPPASTSPLRATWLNHTLIEVLISCHSFGFLGTNSSSLSALIHVFRRVGNMRSSCRKNVN